jgi:hypothetical protein
MQFLLTPSLVFWIILIIWHIKPFKNDIDYNQMSSSKALIDILPKLAGRIFGVPFVIWLMIKFCNFLIKCL